MCIMEFFQSRLRNIRENIKNIVSSCSLFFKLQTLLLNIQIEKK